MRIVPLVGTSNKFKQRKKVDLPEPEGPIIATTSPLCTEVEIPLSTCCFPYDFVSCCTLITATKSPLEHVSQLCKNEHEHVVDRCYKQKCFEGTEGIR